MVHDLLDLEVDAGRWLPADTYLGNFDNLSAAQGLSTTAYHLVNAVPLVCEAEMPGVKTFLDLPLITGCMGTHSAR